MNYVVSICEPQAADILAHICNDMHLPMTVTLHARGTASRSMLDILGIEHIEKRVVLTIASERQTKELIRRQKEELFIGGPSHGIVVAIPIKSIGGGKTLAYLNKQKPNLPNIPNINSSYELIVAIANEGRTDMVIHAARVSGATGGTVLHGKRMGDEGAEQFLNVSIAQEKEVILIVAKTVHKTKIMQNILKKAGPDSEAGTILFSLPTSEVAGFGL